MAEFFPEHESPASLIEARRICYGCPVFERCATWGLEHYPEIMDGVLFGYTAIERRAMWMGQIKFKDWRQTNWASRVPSSNGQQAAREREAIKRGVVAVAAAYHLYEVEDMDERAKIIAAYAAWREDQNWPTTYLQARERAERLAKGRPRTRALASLTKHLKPSCPNGHGKPPMHRVNRPDQHDIDRWSCYTCNAKVVIPVNHSLERTAS